MNERIEQIKNEMKDGNGWVTWDDVKWLIQTIEDQQKELDSWRNEFMGV